MQDVELQPRGHLPLPLKRWYLFCNFLLCFGTSLLFISPSVRFHQRSHLQAMSCSYFTVFSHALPLGRLTLVTQTIHPISLYFLCSKPDDLFLHFFIHLYGRDSFLLVMKNILVRYRTHMVCVFFPQHFFAPLSPCVRSF